MYGMFSVHNSIKDVFLFSVPAGNTSVFLYKLIGIVQLNCNINFYLCHLKEWHDKSWGLSSQQDILAIRSWSTSWRHFHILASLRVVSMYSSWFLSSSLQPRSSEGLPVKSNFHWSNWNQQPFLSCLKKDKNLLTIRLIIQVIVP